MVVLSSLVTVQSTSLFDHLHRRQSWRNHSQLLFSCRKVVFPCAVRYSLIFQRTLLCLKVPRLLPLVLLIRTVLRWSALYIVWGIMLTGQKWRSQNKVWSSANFPPQIAHGLSRDRTLAFGVRSQRLTLCCLAENTPRLNYKYSKRFKP